MSEKLISITNRQIEKVISAYRQEVVISLVKDERSYNNSQPAQSLLGQNLNETQKISQIDRLTTSSKYIVFRNKELGIFQSVLLSWEEIELIGPSLSVNLTKLIEKEADSKEKVISAGIIDQSSSQKIKLLLGTDCGNIFLFEQSIT